MTFVPKIGHIPAGGARTVVASFNAPELASVDEELVLQTQQISFDVKAPEEEPAEEEEEPPASPSKESVLTIPKLPDVYGAMTRRSSGRPRRKKSHC